MGMVLLGFLSIVPLVHHRALLTPDPCTSTPSSPHRLHRLRLQVLFWVKYCVVGLLYFSQVSPGSLSLLSVCDTCLLADVLCVSCVRSANYSPTMFAAYNSQLEPTSKHPASHPYRISSKSRRTTRTGTPSWPSSLPSLTVTLIGTLLNSVSCLSLSPLSPPSS